MGYSRAPPFSFYMTVTVTLVDDVIFSKYDGKANCIQEIVFPFRNYSSCYYDDTHS